MPCPVAENDQPPGEGAAAGGPGATSKGKVTLPSCLQLLGTRLLHQALLQQKQNSLQPQEGNRYIMNTFEIVFPSLSFLSFCLSSCSFFTSPPWEQCYRKLSVVNSYPGHLLCPG